MVDILFVDDEGAVLDGIRRALRSRRGEWSLRFARGADEALDLCAEQAPDIVVTELRLQGIGGEALLERLAAAFPDTVRIVLSGVADPGVALRTVHLAHQFLAKPCVREDLEERLERLVGLRRLLDDEGLRVDLGDAAQLPQAPGVYMELQQAMQRDDVTTTQIAEIVERDPAMATMVLKVVNSAYVGLPRVVHDVERAVVYLGLAMVCDIVLAADAARSVGAGMRRELEAMQSHGAAVAAVAQRIAPRPLAATVRTAGFLHDLGGLFLASRRKKAFRALAKATDDPRDLHDRIVDSWGIAPAHVGAYLLAMWGLPLALVDAVAGAGGPRWKDLGAPEWVHIADHLVHEAMNPGSPLCVAPVLDPAAAASHRLDERWGEWRSTTAKIVGSAASRAA